VTASRSATPLRRTWTSSGGGRANIAAGAKSLDALRDVASADHDRLKGAVGRIRLAAVPNGTVCRRRTWRLSSRSAHRRTSLSTLVPLVHESGASHRTTARSIASRAHFNPPFEARPTARGCVPQDYLVETSTVNWYVTTGPGFSISATTSPSRAGYPPPATVTDPMWLPSTQTLRHQQVDRFCRRAPPVDENCDSS